MNLGSPNDVGLVWMSDMLLPGAAMSPDLMMGSDHRHPFFHADLTHAQPLFLQDVNSMMYLDEGEDGMGSVLEEDFMTKEALQSSGGLHLASLQTHCGSVSLPQMSGTLTPPKRNLSPSQPQSKKIKAVKHPALKLQTPIAYQRDTDINVIPIQRDGMGVCEKCGAIGVKHAFYTRERNYCSLACARTERSNSQSHQQQLQADVGAQLNMDSNSSWSSEPSSVPLGEMMSFIRNQSDSSMEAPPPLTLMNQQGKGAVLPTPGGWTPGSAEPGQDPLSPVPEEELSKPQLTSTFNWDSISLSLPNFHAAPVSNFYHAPMADCWDNITIGMKVEVENTDCDNPDSFWVATVMQVAGYKALVRYEGFGQNSARDFWINLCSSKVHPVGWCASRAKPLIPPKSIEDKYKDWKHFLVKRLTGARTLPSNFWSKVQDSLRSRFRCDLNLEVLDKNRISQVRVATITAIVGKRLHVRYFDADPLDNGFWAHEDSPLLHPVGWARRIGQDLLAPSSYIDRCLKGLRDKDDATQDLFPLYNSLAYHIGFTPGMKLEAVDPLNLSSICVATIMKVLNEGYLMVRIESYEESPNSPGSDWFCYHSTSACILPPGFCEIHNLELTPPSGVAHFSWTDYLASTNSHPAPAELFDLEPAEHNFSVGQKLEAADLMDPRLVCVGTIAMIVGRLLRVHFDGWENDYDQWVDVHSCDLYPVGWAELVSHKLEGPPSQLKPLQKSKGEKGRRKVRGGGKTSGGYRNSGRIPEERTTANRRVPEDGTPVRKLLEDCGADAGNGRLVEDCGSHRAGLGDSVTVHTAAPGSQPLPPGEPVELNSRLGDEPSGPDQSLPDSSHPPPPSTTPNIGKSLVDKTIDSVVSSKVQVPAKKQCLSPKEQVPPTRSGRGDSAKGKGAKICTNSNAATITATVAPLSPSDDSESPQVWSPQDVACFLDSNNCSAYTCNFLQNGITGKMLLDLTKDEIIALTGKVGPSLKIFDLIQQLRVGHKHERHKAAGSLI